jgi:hypothetical protein
MWLDLDYMLREEHKPYVFLIIACLLFNKIGEMGRTGSAFKGQGGEERDGVGGRGEKWP